MGFNTVMVVLNDALGFIEKEPEFGRRVAEAVRADWTPRRSYRDCDVVAQNHCNAATVICQAHADVPQVVVVGRNCGYAVGRHEVGRDPLPEWVVNALKWELERLGYRVSKKPTKAGATP